MLVKRALAYARAFPEEINRSQEGEPTSHRLLADENTSHRFVAACPRLVTDLPIVPIAKWRDGAWLGLDDAALLISCADAGLVLVAFDRATLPSHAGHVVRAGESHGGLVLFRRILRSTDYGHQARILSASDPMTLAASATVLAVAGLLAGWWPARRAARLDPSRALRFD